MPTSKASRPVCAAPRAIPLSLAGAGGHARAGGYPLPCGSQEVLGGPVVVAKTPLGRVLHGPVNGGVETITGVLLDELLGAVTGRHLGGTTLLEGTAVRCVLRTVEDRDRVEAPREPRGTPVEGAASQVGGRRRHTG